MKFNLDSMGDLNTKFNEVALSVKSFLTTFAIDEAFSVSIHLAFGDSVSAEIIEELRQQWSLGNFEELPRIKIRAADEINGANGAYSRATNTIYLSQEFVTHNTFGAITNVLLEEIGHFVDAKINLLDTPGDEGTIFSTLIRGEILDKSQLQLLRGEDDTANVTLDGQVVQIEQATVSDSGGFEGSQETVQLESQGLNLARYTYQFYTIPDQFIIRYEGKEILNTGFVSGGRSEVVKIPDGNSNTLEVIVATNDEGTAWDYTVETTPVEINIDGKLGDIVEVDVVEELQKLGISINEVGLQLGQLRLQSTNNNRGRVAQIDNWETELGNGKFYFAPTVTGTPLQFRAQRNDAGIGESTFALTGGSNGAELRINFNITDGYEEQVTYNTTRLDRYRQEQRLAYLGFPQNSGQPLNVNGQNDGNELSWATKLFNIAVDERAQGRGRIENQPTTLRPFINADNAPRWTDLNGITNFQFVGTPRTFGTDWSASAIEGAISNLGNQLQSTGVSRRNGSGNPSRTHDGGRGVDIDIPGREVSDTRNIAHGTLFFTETSRNRQWYVAAANNQIVINDNGVYRAGNPNNPADLALGLTTTNLINNGPAILPQVSDLLVDNPNAAGGAYNLQNAITIINAFRGQGIQRVFFNDPRTWANGAQYSGAHWGHIHFEVPAQAQAAPLQFQGNLQIPLPSAPTFQKSLSDTVTLSSSLSLANAIDLGAFEGSKNLTGVINSTNPEQYYRLVLGSPVNEEEIEGEYFVTLRNFSLLLNGLSEDVDVELIRDYNEDGSRQDEEVIASSQQTGSSSESINLTELPENVYYVRVFQKSGDTDYNLNLTIPPLPIPPDNAGNSTTQASNLSILSGNSQRSDFIGQVDPDDYYSFTLPTTTDLNIRIGGLENGNLSATLGRDDNNDGIIDFDETIALSDAEGDEAEAINVNGLAAGTYYIWLSRNSGNTNYSLNLSATPSVIPPDRAGNTPSAALDLGSLTGASNHSDFIGNVDPQDFYRFSLASVRGLRLQLDSLSADASLELTQDINNDGVIDSDEIVSTSNVQGSGAEIIDISALAVGTYFARVQQFQGDTNYNLSITPTTAVGSDLSVSRTDNTGSVDLGQQYTYTLTVTNNGPSAATGVVLTENLPSGVNFVSATTTVPFTIFNGVVTADLGNLDSGDNATIDLTVSPFTAGDLISTTNVSSNGNDYNPSNNSLVSTKTVNSITPANADLELTQVVDNPNPQIGEQVTLTLTLINKGPGTATAIEVRDTLPAELSFVSAFTEQGSYDSSTGIWDIGNIRDNLSRSLTITATVNTGQPITNTSEVIAVTEADPDSAPNNNNPNEDDQATVILNAAGEPSITGTNVVDNLTGTTGDDIIIGLLEADILTGNGGNDTFVISQGDGSDTITDFGGVGTGIKPSQATIAQVDIVKFQGEELTARNMLLTQQQDDLLITFKGVNDTKVILQNFDLEDLDNLQKSNGASVDSGNILFEGQTQTQDSFDVVNANQQLERVFRKDTVTFLNDLDNNIKGWEDSNDVINAQGGNDKLKGLGGDDLLRGGLGNDQLLAGEGDDILYGGLGKDTLIGGGGIDTLRGGTGNDSLTGGAGTDRLTGGRGKDRFIFTSRTEGKDTITDFLVVDDTINVSAAGFGGKLKAGAAISAAQFKIGNRAADSSDRFIYNKATGALLFDSDGTGASAQVHFAQLSTGLAMTNNDIFVTA